MRYFFINVDYSDDIIENFSPNGLIKIKNKPIFAYNLDLLKAIKAKTFIVAQKDKFKTINYFLKDYENDYELIEDVLVKSKDVFNYVQKATNSKLYFFKCSVILKANFFRIALPLERENKNVSFTINGDHIGSLLTFDALKDFENGLPSIHYDLTVEISKNEIILIDDYSALEKLDPKTYESNLHATLFTPGPTKPLEYSRKALCSINTHHRSPAGMNAIKKLAHNIQDLFNAHNSFPIIYVSSGTGGIETVYHNLTDVGTKALIINAGYFGQMLVDAAKAYQLDYIELKYDYGQTYKLDDVLKYIDEVDLLFVTHLETSTGALNNIKALADLCKTRKTILIVDSISALVNQEMDIDNWGVDVVMGNSTKGFETVPGIGFCCVSNKALEYAKNIKRDKFYLDWHRAIARDPFKGFLPNTSPINIIQGMNYSSDYIKSIGGPQKVQQLKKELSTHILEELYKLGFTNNVENPECISNWLLAVKTPENISAKKLKAFLFAEANILVELGINDKSDKVVRIAIGISTTQQEVDNLLDTIKLYLGLQSN